MNGACRRAQSFVSLHDRPSISDASGPQTWRQELTARRRMRVCWPCAGPCSGSPIRDRHNDCTGATSCPIPVAESKDKDYSVESESQSAIWHQLITAFYRQYGMPRMHYEIRILSKTYSRVAQSNIRRLTSSKLAMALASPH